MESDSWSRFALAASKRHGQSTVQSRYASAGDASRDPSLRACRDLFLGFEEVDGDLEDSRVEYSCPFCAEDFDIVGLCCHIDDEHPIEAKNGVELGIEVFPNFGALYMRLDIQATAIRSRKLPSLLEEYNVLRVHGFIMVKSENNSARVGLDLVGHMTTQHGNFFKMQRRRRYRKGSSTSHNMLSLFRKDLREGNLQALLGGSFVIPPTAAPDPLLSSLIYTLPIGDSSKDIQSESLDDGSLVKEASDEKLIERVPLSSEFCVVSLEACIDIHARLEPSLSEKDQKERTRRSEFVQGIVLSTIFDDTL